MSILYQNETATLICSETFINNSNLPQCFRLNPNLFKIYSPYRNKSASRRKKKSDSKEEEPVEPFQYEIDHVQSEYEKFLPILKNMGFLVTSDRNPKENTVALQAAEFAYEKSGKTAIAESYGTNYGPPTIQTIEGSNFIFPENCKFFCKNVEHIERFLGENEKHDLIVIDPPWWNKYIRRKKRKSSDGYEMMYNYDLKQIPIENLLTDKGVVVIWCTNSAQHLDYLLNEIFPKWEIHFVAKWYWLKVTINGVPICAFSKPPGKQPFEQILIGYRNKRNHNLPPSGKLLVSVPSAIHSHKPPLCEVLKPFIPDSPNCLEIFARYLLPNWTSYGNEALRLQHESLYIIDEATEF